MKSINTDDQFIKNLKRYLAILVQLDKLIVKYQSDKVVIPEVTPDFNDLPNDFKKLLHSREIPWSEYYSLVTLTDALFCPVRNCSWIVLPTRPTPSITVEYVTPSRENIKRRF